MGYTVAQGKMFYPVGCRSFRGGQPIPENIVNMMRDLGNLSGLLAAGVLVQDSSAQKTEPVKQEQTRGHGRPKFAQIDDAVAAGKLLSEFEADE